MQISPPSSPLIIVPPAGTHKAQEHPDLRSSSDGLKHSEIYAQYGLTPRRSCWQWLQAEGVLW